jgi:hypothetical protein
METAEVEVMAVIEPLTSLGDREGCVERGQAGDMDFDRVTGIVSLTEFREIREGKILAGLLFRSLRL